MSAARFCVRCGTTDDCDDTIAARTVFATALVVDLCSDCNDVVQGPDHIDVETGNIAPHLRIVK